MSTIKVSVIIPCYNVSKSIEQTIECLLNQTLDSIEIIAVDDGSTDNTWEILQKYPSITSYQKTNGGYGSAVNYGLKRAKGEYVAILEDDLIIEDYYYILYQEAKRENLDAVYYNSYLEIHEHIKPTFIQLYSNDTDTLLSEDEICNRLALGNVGIWLGLYNKDFLDRNAILLDEKIRVYEDTPFVANVFSFANRVKIITGCGHFYRRDVEGQSVANSSKFIKILDVADCILDDIRKNNPAPKRRAALLGFAINHLIHYYHQSKKHNLDKLTELSLKKIKSIFEEPTIIGSERIEFFAHTHKIATTAFSAVKTYSPPELKEYPSFSDCNQTSYFNQVISMCYFKLAYSFTSKFSEIPIEIKIDLFNFFNIPFNKSKYMISFFIKYLYQNVTFHEMHTERSLWAHYIIYLYRYENINLMHILYSFPKYHDALTQYPNVCDKECSTNKTKDQKILNSAFIHKKMIQNEQDFLNYITNKSIAIVGNSPCELGLSKGEEIDSHDIIVRFNNYSSEEKFIQDYGKKTDIWTISSDFTTLVPKSKMYSYDYIVSANTPYKHKDNQLSFLHNYFLRNGKFVNIDLSDFLYETNLPMMSMGLSMIKYIVRHLNKIKSLKLYGFSMIDHYEGERHYFEGDPNDMSGKKFHKWTQEATHLKQIINSIF